MGGPSRCGPTRLRLLNLSEPGSEQLCDVLASAEIAAEAGIGSIADTDWLAAGRQAINWLRILVEISDIPAHKAAAAADEVLHRLDELSPNAPRLLHGEGPGCWPLIAHAGTLGLPTRWPGGDPEATAGCSVVPGGGHAASPVLAWCAAGTWLPASR